MVIRPRGEISTRRVPRVSSPFSKILSFLFILPFPLERILFVVEISLTFVLLFFRVIVKEDQSVTSQKSILNKIIQLLNFIIISIDTLKSVILK